MESELKDFIYLTPVIINILSCPHVWDKNIPGITQRLSETTTICHS